MPNAPTERFEDVIWRMNDIAKNKYFPELARGLRRDSYGALADLLSWYGPLKIDEVIPQIEELGEQRDAAMEKLEKLDDEKADASLTWSQPLDTRENIQFEIAKCIRDIETCRRIINKAQADALEASRIWSEYQQYQRWPLVPDEYGVPY
nr:hypothetical protein CFP56_79438 [Quercus suber]